MARNITSYKFNIHIPTEENNEVGSKRTSITLPRYLIILYLRVNDLPSDDEYINTQMRLHIQRHINEIENWLVCDSVSYTVAEELSKQIASKHFDLLKKANMTLF